jgi:hypothetical protein
MALSVRPSHLSTTLCTALWLTAGVFLTGLLPLIAVVIILKGWVLHALLQ